jgi:outer membrane protein OmpA-like peptidoglycan-associated protein
MDPRRHLLGWSRRVLDAHPLPEPVMPASQPNPAQRQILVRQVTHVQASWTEQERGDAGAFTLQLILDHGADEYVLRPTAEDTDVLVKLLARSSNATFDVERKVLMFGNLAIE